MASGQVINKEKSSVFFGSKCSKVFRENITRIMDIQTGLVSIWVSNWILVHGRKMSPEKFGDENEWMGRAFPFSKHGDYSVKSGYKVACRMISSGELDNLLQGVGFGLWRCKQGRKRREGRWGDLRVSCKQPSEQKKWKKLPFGSWKVNCDAVWNVKRGTRAVGWGHPRLCRVAANGRWHG
ncbi:hypothetical protein DVH24_019837 [Malus domestica]|uniref:Uncharacterized protein n=1 Tax=Malus domestica TaxID=3750 RepID=A0A498I1Y4_MALDO|nr:hypothetical protein DVH24_019837 [Malus domestica]